MNIQITITRGDSEIDVDCEIDHTPPYRGKCNSLGVPMEQGHGDVLNFSEARDTSTWQLIDLNDYEKEKALEKAQDLLDAQRWAGR